MIFRRFIVGRTLIMYGLFISILVAFAYWLIVFLQEKHRVVPDYIFSQDAIIWIANPTLGLVAGMFTLIGFVIGLSMSDALQRLQTRGKKR